jgi:bifunctional pyridoxal-dependent enzyme with beta-cystathionase and maltose regulon repressor activities
MNMDGFSIAAPQAAYQYGGEWLKQLKYYLDDNFVNISAYLPHEENLPEINSGRRPEKNLYSVEEVIL